MTIATPAPSHWRAIAYPRHPRRRPRNLDALWLRAQAPLARLTHRSGTYLSRADRILSLQSDLKNANRHDLEHEANELRAIFRVGRDSPEDLDRALALAGELAHHALAMRPFRVQIAAALALLDGCITELATGEGKTVVAALAASINGWRGKGCHVVTANDYLAARDAAWMRPLFTAMGLTVESVTQTSDHAQRTTGYGADVTYTTNREVAADFLRDGLSLGSNADLTQSLARNLACASDTETAPLLLRGLPFAIIDEADSVLIDDAVTPLILSGTGDNHTQADAYTTGASLAAQLKPNTHYRVDRRRRDVELTDAGHDRIEELAKPLAGIWHAPRRREELILQALTAREHFNRDEHYIIRDGRAVIVDESTGRTLPDRTWRAGLHQAIEAGESLEIQPMRDTLARISFQRFFSMYDHLSGMSGTAREAQAEFWTTYGLPTVSLPTNRACRRTLRPPGVTTTTDAKWRLVVEEVRREHESSRPVLIGTTTIAETEHLSALLEQCGLVHSVLNARCDKEEAAIIERAGRAGAITVATNMAGRGTDIKLGQGVPEAGGLHVIATSFHDSARVDRQLLGRAARQGDPGSGSIFASTEDPLLERFARPGRRIARFTPPPISTKIFRFAQRRARAHARTQRRLVMDADERFVESLAFAGPEH